jgi:hypothetical protein
VTFLPAGWFAIVGIVFSQPSPAETGFSSPWSVDRSKRMDSDDYAKIESSVGICLDECRATDRPYVRISAFLDQLKADGWEDRDIMELQTRVIRKLLERQHCDE